MHGGGGGVATTLTSSLQFSSCTRHRYFKDFFNFYMDSHPGLLVPHAVRALGGTAAVLLINERARGSHRDMVIVSVVVAVRPVQTSALGTCTRHAIEMGDIFRSDFRYFNIFIFSDVYP